MRVPMGVVCNTDITTYCCWNHVKTSRGTNFTAVPTLKLGIVPLRASLYTWGSVQSRSVIMSSALIGFLKLLMYSTALHASDEARNGFGWTCRSRAASGLQGASLEKLGAFGL